MVIFVLKLLQFLMNFLYNSKNKNRNINFSSDSAHCASFMKMAWNIPALHIPTKDMQTRGGDLHILSWDRAFNFNEIPSYLFKISLVGTGPLISIKHLVTYLKSPENNRCRWFPQRFCTTWCAALGDQSRGRTAPHQRPHWPTRKGAGPPQRRGELQIKIKCTCI